MPCIPSKNFLFTQRQVFHVSKKRIQTGKEVYLHGSMPSVSIAAYSYTLNLNSIISPSCTTYSFPSSLTRPFFFRCRMCSTCHKVIIADNFRTDKSAFKIRMDLSCRLRRFRSSLDRPCTDFRFSRRQVTDQTEKMITCADQFFKTRLFQSQFLKEHRLFVIIKLGKSLLLSPHIQRTLHSPRLPHTHEPPLLLHCSHHRPQRSSSDTFAAKITGFAVRRL